MIVVTGAAGFIGSRMVAKLNAAGYDDVVAVDDFSSRKKNLNLSGCRVFARVDRGRFSSWLDENHRMVQFIFHLGARTDTAEFDVALLNRLNLHYSQEVWNKCVSYGLPMVYASSAATYGAGEHGFEDNHAIVPDLQPLNPYGVSKNEFDKWALDQQKSPYYWVGLKFFNVYGPNESHKDRMASVVWHTYRQIKETGKMKLFQSHIAGFKDGEQRRDFIFVDDVTEVLLWLMHNRIAANSGIYNLGTGTARTFLDLARSVFENMNAPANIEFIPIPADIRDKYQYFTEASMEKLRRIGYAKPFHTLEEGIGKYVHELETMS
ncbi:MAG: ADP-glyceromanno-heptose 6-epimerase [Bacteroidota bacterium]|nr:ADP-glyceromanno-heptose 6-epimerase [Bacteroidota bacterium]